MKRFASSFTFVRGSLVPDDPDSLSSYKSMLKEGDKIRCIFEPYPEHRADRAANLFHALRDRYCQECGVGREKTKIDMKLAHGVVLPIKHNFHCDRAGQVVELPNGSFVFAVSTNEYTLDEMNNLIKGTINECLDAQVDIEDLMQEFRS